MTEQDVALAVLTYWPAGHGKHMLPFKNVPGVHGVQFVWLASAYEPDEQAVHAIAEAPEMVPMSQL